MIDCYGMVLITANVPREDTSLLVAVCFRLLFFCTASHCFISRAWVDRAHAHLQPLAGEDKAALADGGHVFGYWHWLVIWHVFDTEQILLVLVGGGESIVFGSIRWCVWST